MHCSHLFDVPQRVKRYVDEPLISVQSTKHRKRMGARMRLDWVLGLGDKTRDSRAFTEEPFHEVVAYQTEDRVEIEGVASLIRWPRLQARAPSRLDSRTPGDARDAPSALLRQTFERRVD